MLSRIKQTDKKDVKAIPKSSLAGREQTHVRELRRPGLRSYSAAPGRHRRGRPRGSGVARKTWVLKGAAGRVFRGPGGQPGRGLFGPETRSRSAGAAVGGVGHAVRPRRQGQGVEPIEEQFGTASRWKPGCTLLDGAGHWWRPITGSALPLWSRKRREGGTVALPEPERVQRARAGYSGERC
ncbi:hypothetical protein NDU88_009165 [Pleurodeles waltl]|uniref:Uncharacterized protein n=1 Tax=Pleurodeles waltl TaxID=8319 RepID=A0AAV7PWH9_PLEWA|nr:hypothetical protein NDU88_009165 [Pleurodeles waltl]